MRKTDLITQVSILCNRPQRDVAAVIDCFLDKIVRSLEKEEKVVLRNFGTFSSKVRKGRPARDFMKGEEIFIQDRVCPHFCPSKNFRYRVEKIKNTSVNRKRENE